MGNSVDHRQAESILGTRCPHCHASTSPRKRTWADLFNSLFYWTLIIVNIVVLSLGAMEQNQPPHPFKEDPDCWSEPRMPRIEFITLETSETPKEVLERDFPELVPLPIRGGWGYDLATACIIEPPDDPGLPFDGVEVEYVFAAHRTYEELMFFRGLNDSYEDVSFQLLHQMLQGEGDRYYDVLTVQVSARPVEWTAPAGNAKKGRRAPVHTGEREFWFDITSFYGS